MSEQPKIEKPIAVLTTEDVIRQFENLFPSPQEMEQIEDLATIILNSHKFTDYKTKDELKVIILKARALKIDPLHALNHIHVFQGKVTASAELQMYLILRSFPKAIKQFQLNDKACGIVVQRPGMNEVPFKFSVEDALAAHLCFKDAQGNIKDKGKNGFYDGSYAKFMQDMLRSRTVSRMARSIFPDVVQGLSYTPEDFGEHYTEAGQ